MESSALAFKSQLQGMSFWAEKRNLSHRYGGGQGCFEEMSPEQKILAITGLKKYFDFLQAIDNPDIDFGNTLHLLKAAVRQLDIHLPFNLLDRILPTDHVEIYTRDLVPAYKSINFWGNCSYTLDELYSYPYGELFARDEFYQAALNRAGEKIFSGKEVFLENPVPEHLAWEVRGPMKRKIKYRYISAVYEAGGELFGLMVVSNITPLSN